MRLRVIPLALPGPIYRRLEQLAQAEDRDAVQQARHIVKRWVDAAADEDRQVVPGTERSYEDAPG